MIFAYFKQQFILSLWQECRKSPLTLFIPVFRIQQLKKNGSRPRISDPESTVPQEIENVPSKQEMDAFFKILVHDYQIQILRWIKVQEVQKMKNDTSWVPFNIWDIKDLDPDVQNGSGSQPVKTPGRIQPDPGLKHWFILRDLFVLFGRLSVL